MSAAEDAGATSTKEVSAEGNATVTTVVTHAVATATNPDQSAGATHSAFLFIKPHACVDAVKDLVEAKLAESGLSVVSQGRLEATEIDQKRLIDQHYGAIANRAVRQQPNELAVSDKGKAAFAACFAPLTWEQALEQGLVLNATAASERLGVDALGLENAWRVLRKDENLVKLGGGFYVGNLSDDNGKFFVVNAFYLNMRAVFTTPPAAIHWFNVSWPSSRLSWADFRGKVLGATDPSAAPDGSIRKAILDSWQELGLPEQPNTGLNGVHASASPLEGLFERMNWLSVDASDDPFGAELIAAGASKATLEAWSNDPPVEFEGKTGSLFDLFEDLDAPEVLARVAAVVAST